MNGDWATILCFVSRQIGKQYAYRKSGRDCHPMAEDGSVDYAALDRLVDFHIENGTSGIVAVGTTGESATLAVDEHLKVVESVVKRANKRVAVIAGTGANSTREAIELTEAAASLGVDSAAVGCALLQPPDARRHVSAFQGDCRGLPAAADSVQCARSHCGGYVQRHRAASGGNLQYHRHQDATGNLERACDLVRRARPILPCTLATTPAPWPLCCAAVTA